MSIHLHDLHPAAQVEHDLAEERGEPPPCRALVRAAPMPGDWCWRSHPLLGVAIVLPPLGARPGVIRTDAFFDRPVGRALGMYAVPSLHRPMYRVWSDTEPGDAILTAEGEVAIASGEGEPVVADDPEEVMCTECDGTGEDWADWDEVTGEPPECDACGGWGYVEEWPE